MRNLLRHPVLRLKYRKVQLPCSRCNGEGEYEVEGMGDLPNLPYDCSTCDGTGKGPAFYEPRQVSMIPLDPTPATVRANQRLGGDIGSYKREQLRRLVTEG